MIIRVFFWHTDAVFCSLIPAARLSGTSIDDVGAAPAKFSKNLIDVQSGTGKAAEAFKALGFNAQDAARFLNDPTQGLFELSQRLNDFATDGNKTAVVMELLGKSGANLIPFLKELGGQTDLVTRVTDQQAQAAKRLQDQWVELGLAGDELKNTIATSVVSALGDAATSFNIARKERVDFLGAINVSGASTENIGERIQTMRARVVELTATLEDLKKRGSTPGFFGPTVTNAEGIAAYTARLEEATKKLNAYIAVSDRLAKNESGSQYGLNDRGIGQDVTLPSLKVNTAGSGGVNEFQQALQALQKQAAEASAELDAIFSGEKITQAEKYLATLKANTAVWDTW